MSAEFIGFTLDVIGKIMVAYTAIAVHRRVWQEHKIDKTVFIAMKNEQVVGIAGIILIVIGFLLQIPSKTRFTQLSAVRGKTEERTKAYLLIFGKKEGSQLVVTERSEVTTN